MRKQSLKVYFFWSIVLITILTYAICSCSAESITEIARKVINDAGIISSSWEGKSGKSIVIFEENHASRVGQAEIALMLTRLHNNYGIDMIALEGALAEDGALDGKWFHNFTDKDIQKEIALRLLREGEISGTEFIALAIPEVKVYGVEKEEEYNLDTASVNDYSTLIYLFAIAEKLFPKDSEKISQANELAKQYQNATDSDKPRKFKIYMDYMLNANEWTKERYQKLKNDKIVSVEEMLAFLNDIKTKATEVNAKVEPYKDGFDKSIKFYEMAAKRTNTIVYNTIGLCDEKKESKAALIIGAAHTAKACEMLKGNNVSYCVITPLALKNGDDIGDLTRDAFKRKQNKQSVDNNGMIGSFLDKRWKPSPVLNEVWFRSKSEICYASTILAHAVMSGDRPPFDSLKNEFSQLKYIKIDPESFEVINDEVIFKVEAQTNIPNQNRTFWVRSATIPELANKKGKKSLEERITDVRKELKNEGFLCDIGSNVQIDLDNDRITKKLIEDIGNKGVR